MTNDVELLAVLQRHGVPVVVVGGHAVNFHGFTRATEDLDVVWIRSAKSEEDLLNALTEVDAKYIGKEIDPATKIEKVYAVTLPYIQANHLMLVTTRFGFLDLFDYVPGLPAEDPQQLLDSSVVESGVRYVSLDWLRKLKTASGRPKDLLDLQNLPE
jgi:hypothetical protein